MAGTDQGFSWVFLGIAWTVLPGRDPFGGIQALGRVSTCWLLHHSLSEGQMINLHIFVWVMVSNKCQEKLSTYMGVKSVICILFGKTILKKPHWGPLPTWAIISSSRGGCGGRNSSHRGPHKAVPGCQAIIHGCVPESLVRNSHFQSNNNLQARHFAASSKLSRIAKDSEQFIP